VKTVLRIVVAILCVIALYYLVVMLARSVTQEDVGLGPVPTIDAVAGRGPACPLREQSQRSSSRGICNSSITLPPRTRGVST
jgi:hypothetical protein